MADRDMTTDDAPASTSSISSSGGRRVLLEPWVLIHLPGGIGLVWSPKSACTTAIV
jgi:hypothetical protein